MILTGVTLTGADETIEQDILIDLSTEFPFVEWGILVGSRASVARFPGLHWLAALAERLEQRKVPVNLSLHICGNVLRCILDDARLVLSDEFPVDLFRRAQLNFHGTPVSACERKNLLSTIGLKWPFDETIVQLDSVNDFILDELLKQKIRASGLYDRSHGAGVVPEGWPLPNLQWDVGYAGGLGPDNICLELERIAEAAGSHRFWIDMETKLRTCNGRVFDFRLARSVLMDTAQHFPRRGAFGIISKGV